MKFKTLLVILAMVAFVASIALSGCNSTPAPKAEPEKEAVVTDTENQEGENTEGVEGETSEKEGCCKGKKEDCAKAKEGGCCKEKKEGECPKTTEKTE